LGSGVSGVVREVVHKATGVKYAVKCLDLGLIECEEAVIQLREEIYIMCQLDHPNIVRLEEVYEGVSEIYLVMELCLGGDLFDRLDEQTDYHYTEDECARLIKQMLNSVQYLHSKKIIHRDLKLENFLFSNSDADSTLKMIDFGLSKHFVFGEIHSEAVGTPYTVAPEVIKGQYNQACDIWGVGVITYLLLSGETPFGGADGEDLMDVRRRILNGRVHFVPADIWENVSPLAKEFCLMLLKTDPFDRPSAKSAREHKWIKTGASATMRQSQVSKTLNPHVINSLVAFKEYSDMRKLLCEVLSFTLLPDQISGLREEFEKIDNGDGEISLIDLKTVLLASAGTGTLGGLTEQEVDDIFNALRVRKTETKIRWHEFIAAGLSQCEIDERNLKLAFDRLDTDRRGYITFENLMRLMGDSFGNTSDMQMMWTESLCHCKSNSGQISYEDFLILMKGQALAPDLRRTRSIEHPARFGQSASSLGFVPEDKPSPITKRSVADMERFEMSSDLKVPEEGDDKSTTRKKLDFKEKLVDTEESPPKDRHHHRSRSRSLSMEHRKTNPFFDESDDDMSTDMLRPPLLAAYSAKALAKVTQEKSQTPLMANKALYRAHRELRLAVLDASKRFEEEQSRRKVQRLAAQGVHVDERKNIPGLTARRGTAISPAPSHDADELQQLLDVASVKSGRRPRGRRHKTVSDMTAMMAGVTQNGVQL